MFQAAAWLISFFYSLIPNYAIAIGLVAVTVMLLVPTKPATDSVPPTLPLATVAAAAEAAEIPAALVADTWLLP